MDLLAQKKISEASQLIADAEKSLKTSFFKRKPDYDAAAQYYGQAGTCYKVAKDLNKAIECFKKSADLYKQNDSLYHAAKQYEQAGFIANEAKDYNLVYELIEQSADLMLLTGTRDSAGIILERAANMIKLNDPENALKLFKKTIHVADVEDKKREMIVFYEQSVALAVKLNQLNEALELITQLMEILQEIGTEEQIKKYVLSTVIIHLSKDDWVSAKNYLENMKVKFDASRGGFNRIDDLLNAFDEKDDDRMKTIIKNYLTYAVDNEFLKMVNKIIKSEEWIREAQAVQEQNKKTHVSNMTDSYHIKPKNYGDTNVIEASNNIPSHQQQTAVADDDEEELDLR